MSDGVEFGEMGTVWKTVGVAAILVFAASVSFSTVERGADSVLPDALVRAAGIALQSFLFLTVIPYLITVHRERSAERSGSERGRL